MIMPQNRSEQIITGAVQYGYAVEITRNAYREGGDERARERSG